MGKVKAEASTVTLALESSFGVAPATGWQQVQVNPGGIGDWMPKFKTVERDPLSKYASREKGDNVGLDADPKLSHDFNKDWIDLHATSMFRVVAKHSGGTGQSLFRPTAVAATGYTVGALGALPNNVLVFARGFGLAANNGLKLLAGTSTNIEIKTAGLAVEALTSPYPATVEVAGVQGASGDITMNASGNLTAATLNFTTLGLNVGQWIYIGGKAANTFFATAAYNGRARIVSIAAGLITLERRSWAVGAQDLGTGKTIQIFFTRWYRNVAIDSADYLEPSLHGELEEIGAGVGDTSTFTYAPGMTLKTMEIDAPLESKIVCTASYVAKDIEDPVLLASRKAGAASAFLPLASALVDTATDLKQVRLTDALGDLIAEINSWKLTYETNVKGRKVQGVFGTKDMTHGKFEPMVTMEAYYTSATMPAALRDNRDLAWDAFVANHQGGYLFDLPYVALRGGSRAYAANEPVMISVEIPGFRDPVSNIVSSMSVFAHIP